MDSSLFDQVAGRVLHDSLRLKKRENLAVEAWNNGLPFARRVLVQARELGASPVLLFEDEDSYVEGLRKTPKDSVGKMGRHEHALLSKTDAYVFIPGPVLGGSPRLTREEAVASMAYNSSWYKAAKAARLRGARLTFGYAGAELARVLEKDLQEIVEHQLKAALVDFRKIRAKGRRLAKLMRTGQAVAIRAEGDELKFRLSGGQELDDGVVDRADMVAGNNMTNVPPGYFAKGIVPTTVSGAVRIHAPLARVGKVVDIRLEFKNGKLESWESENSQEWLDGIISRIPVERRRCSDVAVGLNPAIMQGYAQDRLAEGAITLFGMFQGTMRNGGLEVQGRPVVDDGRLVEADQGRQYRTPS